MSKPSQPAFPAPPPTPAASGFADALKARTAALHTRAERSGIIAAIFSGQATLAGYALFLRNLLPVYSALEGALARHEGEPRMGPLARRELFRSNAIERDLSRLGARLSSPLPVLPEGEDYARRIASASERGAHSLLLAHAYTRYLGDLAGGRILSRRLAQELRLEADALSFYAFPGIADVGAFAREYRSALDSAAALLPDTSSAIEEGVVAFELNIALSEAVARRVAVSHPA